MPRRFSDQFRKSLRHSDRGRLKPQRRESHRPVQLPHQYDKRYGRKLYCTPDDVFCDFVGINHLVWARRVLVRGEDVTAAAIEKLCSESAKEVMANIPEIHYDPTFLKSLGMVPVSYLKYYYMQPEMFSECDRAAKEEGCRAEVIKQVEKDLFALYQDPALDIKPPQLAKRGGARYSDAACSLIDSIYNIKRTSRL